MNEKREKAVFVGVRQAKIGKNRLSLTGENKKSVKNSFPSRGKTRNQLKTAFPHGGKQEISGKQISLTGENQKTAKTRFPSRGKIKKQRRTAFPHGGNRKTPKVRQNNFRSYVHFLTLHCSLAYKCFYKIRKQEKYSDWVVNQVLRREIKKW